MKLYIYATQIDQVLVGDFEWSLTVSTRDDIVATNWQVIGEVDVELDIDREKLTAKAMQAIEEKESEVKAEAARKLELLERKKSELLALTYIAPEK